jgi:hypothetical protein
MSKFLGRRYITQDGYGSGGVSDHGLLAGLLDDDHPQYLFVSAVRNVDNPVSGINKTGTSAGDVFSLTNAGTGAALYIQQTGATNNADAALDIDNTINPGRALSVSSQSEFPLLPLVQFSALSTAFDEPVLLITHADPRGLGLAVYGDAYVSGQIFGPQAVTFTNSAANPIALGEAGVYIKGEPGEFYFVDKTGYERTFCDGCDTGGISIGGDGYFPFVEIDELTMSGEGSGTLTNTRDYASNNSLIRIGYNNFLIGRGLLEIKGLTLRSTIDGDLTPNMTYDVIKEALLVADNDSRTILVGGEVVSEGLVATASETFSSGRKDSLVQFTTGALNLDDSAFDSTIGSHDGYYYFVFHGSHTFDTKTIVVNRMTIGPRIGYIHFTYPTCAFAGTQQTAVRSTQSFGVEVATLDGYAPAVFMQIQASGAIQSPVSLTETFTGSGIWVGSVTARTGQPDGYAEITVYTYDMLHNDFTTTTSEVGDPLVLFDNNFPVVETFEEASDVVYPIGQYCLKFGESADAYMSVSDFTNILYSSPNARLTIDNPTLYEERKTITWSTVPSSIEENANIISAPTTVNARIRARKYSNCSETTRDIQIRLDDTPPVISSIRWRRNNSGSYNLTSPTLGVGTHGIQVVFDDPLISLPDIIAQDSNKGTLSAWSGTIPGTTFTATLTVSSYPTDSDGCSKLVLVTGINCSQKLPLAVDPISGNDENYCLDVTPPDIISVEIDIDLSDGYWNDGYTGLNIQDDDADNLDNTVTASQVDFSSGVQSILSNDILTRHGYSVYTTVLMATQIQSDETCVFNASPWGASSSVSLPKLDDWLWQGPFVTNLGSTRLDDKSRAIGRASVWHATGNSAVVTDSALNSDSAANIDVLSANGMDAVASPVYFSANGTVGGAFYVAIGSFRAFMPGRVVQISDSGANPTILRKIVSSVIDGSNGLITVSGGSLASYTTTNSAKVVPLSVTDAELKAWDSAVGLISYVNDAAFTVMTVCDLANPEAFSQHLSNDQLTQNNSGTVGVDLFRAAFWGSKISVPNTNGGTEHNPTGVSNSKYVWRSKKLRLTTNPTGLQGTTIRFMVFGFAAGTQYRNVNITAASDWDQNSNRFDLGTNDAQIDVRISVDEPFAAGVQPISTADWFLTTDYRVSPQSGFKFGKDKDINIVFNSPSTDIIDKDIYVEITLTTNSSGKAPQIDMLAFAYLT